MSQSSNHKGNQLSSLCRGPATSDRGPSPLYADNAPHTILNTVDTTEPITAIFMGFQTAQDDIGPGQEFEGSLKVELVIIKDRTVTRAMARTVPTGRRNTQEVLVIIQEVQPMERWDR
ncbi:palmdelphin isoform X1 [Xyrichtys novacula]|uniref:Palmdelphin isoform X1 n=1 Tax=Xyrichtys novacula TaxID=13765 RepID=A0AAV1GFE6_XYRNO|nr:palmdelphin isoform X1 [Xyrichtys novacula]